MCHDWTTGEISHERMFRILTAARNHYSEEFVNVVEKMLEIEETLRIDSESLLRELEDYMKGNVNNKTIRHSKIYKFDPMEVPSSKQMPFINW